MKHETLPEQDVRRLLRRSRIERHRAQREAWELMFLAILFISTGCGMLILWLIVGVLP